MGRCIFYYNSPSRQQSESADVHGTTESEPSNPEAPLSPKGKSPTRVPGTDKTVEEGGYCSTFEFQDIKLIDLTPLIRKTLLNMLPPRFGNERNLLNSWVCSGT